jgi:hypothetical protein
MSVNQASPLSTRLGAGTPFASREIARISVSWICPVLAGFTQ